MQVKVFLLKKKLISCNKLKKQFAEINSCMGGLYAVATFGALK